MCSFYNKKLPQVEQHFQYCSFNKTGKDGNYGIAVVKSLSVLSKEEAPP